MRRKSFIVSIYPYGYVYTNYEGENRMTTNQSHLRGMTAAALTKKLLGKEPIFILDVRNEADYNDWKMEGKHIQTINIPYFELLDGVESILDQLPDHQEILVVCAKEGSSKFVA